MTKDDEMAHALSGEDCERVSGGKLLISTMAIGEEDAGGWCRPWRPPFEVTTQALGEESPIELAGGPLDAKLHK